MSARKSSKCNFPLPHGVWTSAFAHRNPPRSLWLRHIHRMCRLTRRAHIPFPLCTSFEGTHGTAPRGDTLGTRIDRDISLVMPLRFMRRLRNNTAQSLVLFVKLGARSAHRRCGSKFRLRNRLQLREYNLPLQEVLYHHTDFEGRTRRTTSSSYTSPSCR